MKYRIGAMNGLERNYKDNEWTSCYCPYQEAEANCADWCPMFEIRECKYEKIKPPEQRQFEDLVEYDYIPYQKVILHCCGREIGIEKEPK